MLVYRRVNLGSVSPDINQSSETNMFPSFSEKFRLRGTLFNQVLDKSYTSQCGWAIFLKSLGLSDILIIVDCYCL